MTLLTISGHEMLPTGKKWSGGDQGAGSWLQLQYHGALCAPHPVPLPPGPRLRVGSRARWRGLRWEEGGEASECHNSSVHFANLYAFFRPWVSLLVGSSSICVGRRGRLPEAGEGFGWQLQQTGFAMIPCLPSPPPASETSKVYQGQSYIRWV